MKNDWQNNSESYIGKCILTKNFPTQAKWLVEFFFLCILSERKADLVRLIDQKSGSEKDSHGNY